MIPIRIQTVFGAVAAVRHEQLVGQGQCRRLIAEIFTLTSLSPSTVRMRLMSRHYRTLYRDGLVAFDTKSDRLVEQEPGVAGG
jgi:hypothetical protein